MSLRITVDKVMHSASMVESRICIWSMLFHRTCTEPKMLMKPVQDCTVVGSSASLALWLPVKSASTQQSKERSPLGSIMRPLSRTPFGQCPIFFRALLWAWQGLVQWWAHAWIAQAHAGWVLFPMHCGMPKADQQQKLWWNGGESTCLNSGDAIGVVHGLASLRPMTLIAEDLRWGCDNSMRPLACLVLAPICETTGLCALGAVWNNSTYAKKLHLPICSALKICSASKGAGLFFKNCGIFHKLVILPLSGCHVSNLSFLWPQPFAAFQVVANDCKKFIKLISDGCNNNFLIKNVMDH